MSALIHKVDALVFITEFISVYQASTINIKCHKTGISHGTIFVPSVWPDYYLILEYVTIS